MARIVTTAMLIVILNVMAGCGGADKGKGQLKAPRGSTGQMIEIGSAAETDLIEQVAINRQTYQRAIEMLVGHYENTGNTIKSRWAKKELDSLNKMAQYEYIIDATVTGPELRATASIPEADELYNEAVELHKDAKKLVLIKDKSLLRLALDKYNEVIRRHPTSDKIDDAAFKAGEIYEYFKDYSIALVYFKRTFQWNAANPYPARFRAAAILDEHMRNMGEALGLYQEAIELEAKDGKFGTWKEFAQRRIDEINKVYKPQLRPIGSY
jgi:tetratricopeptide (TPR) repeat protein